MEVMLRRSNFRDYYDIYSILKSGISTNNLVFRALTYSSNVFITIEQPKLIRNIRV